MSGRKTVLVAALLCAFGVNTATGQAADAPSPDAEVPLRVGVRSDAKPFVFLEDGERKGLLFKMCDHIFKAAGLNVDYVPIKAGDRTRWLGEENKIDVLCDPFTITRARASQFLFSPVVFVSGGSFLYFPKASDENYVAARARVAEMATVESHTGAVLTQGAGGVYEQAADGAAVARQTQPIACSDLGPNQIGAVRIGIIKGSTALEIVANAMALEEPVIKAYAYETICYVEVEDHEDGISQLCRRQGADTGEALSYYFGDRDIIVAYLASLQENDGPCAGHGANSKEPVEVSSKFFSSEPYGIAFSPRVDPQVVIRFQAALLETFSTLELDPDDQSVVTTKPFQWFKRYFPNKQPSQPVRSAFSTLIVPEK